jgi:CPA2 family monovalent cation:H+ antiporter-2
VGSPWAAARYDPAVDLGSFLGQAVAVFGAAVVVVLICHRLRLPSLVGLLVTGVLIGPSALGLVHDAETIELFAEIGVVLLLFVIGLELSLDRLKEMGRPFLLGGSLQAALTLGLVAGGAVVLGAAPAQAVFFGMVVTLSSTVIVLKLLDDRRESQTPHGKVALAILLFQDFLIVPMIVLAPVLGGAVAASAGALALRFGGSLAAVALVVLAARVLMPRVLHLIVRTRSRELFVLGALAICLGMAWATHSFGFSLALGAFVAGLLVSETEYSHQVFADVAPFRDVFASVFFVSIGMLVDVGAAAERWPQVLGLAAAIVAVKALACGGAAAALRYPVRTVAAVGLGLAQIGEFAFVLMEVGRRHGLLDSDRYQLLLAAAVLTMLVTPGLTAAAPALAGAWLRRTERSPAAEGGASGERSGHVVVIGFGVGGKLLARVLRETGIPYVVIELNGETVRRAAAAGEPILYGDASSREILEHAGVARAAAVVFVITDPPAVRRAVAITRQLNPAVEIIVRTRLVQEIEDLRRLGANQVVAEEFEAAIEIFTRVLERFHVPRNVVRAQTRLLRGEGYAMLRAPSLREGVSEAVLGALAAGTTDVFRVEEGSTAAGRTLSELDLRRRCGASVIALVRGERTYPNPSAEQRLEPGDDLVLVGSHAEVDTAFSLLS